MPEKRMFTKKITESDAFLDMPLSSQCLYFHLNMNADDDGFVNNPRRIMRTIGASEDDLKLLIAKAFILVFESGVIVIKHWRMHNTLRNDRYKPTDYREEYAMLGIKENKAYTWQPIGNQLETQPNLTKPNQTKPRDDDVLLEERRLREAFGDHIVNQCMIALGERQYTGRDLMQLCSKYDDINDLDAYVYRMFERREE